MPLYILDANVLITAHREYYPHRRVPEFWGWLARAGEVGFVTLPAECYEEIADNRDDWLANWVKDADNKKALLFEEEADAAIVARVIDEGYAPDLTDVEVEEIGRDPFLVAYGMVQPDRVIVTNEVSRPAKQRANKKVPDVCDRFSVRHCNTYAMLDALKFTTGWKPSS